jgi:malonyl-CoA O-methyltransferase
MGTNILAAPRHKAHCPGGSSPTLIMTLPQDEAPVPELDPVAAQRWLARVRNSSPWLHEEVARRMIERLQWFRDPPVSWMHWEPGLGGIEAHRVLLERLPGADVHIWSHDGRLPEALRTPAPRGFLDRLPWRRPADRGGVADVATVVSMVWANMALHQVARPQALLRQWHRQVDTGGFLMFSCLGPDSLRELRRLYTQLGWPAPSHPFTDMHDWGDMLVHAGFAEPVMDMERITLTYSSADAMLDELRGLGRNLSAGRFGGLRARSWRQRLLGAIEEQGARDNDGRLLLTFEVIYGHAFKAERRSASSAKTVSVDEMRAMLRSRKP